jgi:hypothetical protein
MVILKRFYLCLLPLPSMRAKLAAWETLPEEIEHVYA